MAAPKFKRNLRKMQAVAMREMRDGCLECREVRGYCNEHYVAAVNIILNPRKYLRDRRQNIEPPAAENSLGG